MFLNQHSDCVELRVIEVLAKRFKSDRSFERPLDYINWKFEPSGYPCALSLKKDYVLRSLLRKWKGFDGVSNQAENALGKWILAERQCFMTNRRLENEASTGIYSVAPRIISDAQRKILRVLGRLSIKRLDELARFSKGAAVGVRHGTPYYDKMVSSLSITSRAYPHFLRLLSGDLLWQSCLGDPGFEVGEIVRENELVMVPKDALTHRIICKEPLLNGFLQQGVGRFIRSRLKSFGVNLDDQTINQDFAFASLVDDLSTIDLASASDTVSYSLVKLLLPPDWFEYLDDLRVSHTKYKGRSFLLSKFSSMGNAFTFELESLIFWALLSSVREGGNFVSVYGDDIIVRNSDYHVVTSVIKWAGFSINHDKSYTSPSRFFESCGRHYFDLEDVTPPFQKDVCSRPSDFIRFHNRLVRAGLRLGLSNEFIDACRLIQKEYERTFRRRCVFGPMIDGDLFFIDLKIRFTSDRQKFLVLIPKRFPQRVDESKETCAYAYKLRRPETENPSFSGHFNPFLSIGYTWRYTYLWRSAYTGPV